MKKAFLLAFLFSTLAQSSTLRFDFPEVRVGTAEYPQGPTGCTVFVFPKAYKGAIDIRGGAAAVRDGSALDPLNAYGVIDALVFAGGSSYGLDAASGVMERFLQLKKGSTHFDDIPAVAGAVIYDFTGRNNNVFPDRKLGAEAFDVARANLVEIGRKGAGANATVGKYFGRNYLESNGQGAAFLQRGPVKVFVLTVVNAVGNILDRKGNVIRGSLDPKSNTRFSIPEKLLNTPPDVEPHEVPKGNTTLTVLITNVRLSRGDLQRLAVMAHTGMGRTIEPFSTPYDGDTFIAVTSDSVDLPANMDIGDLGTLGVYAAQEAVLKSVP